MSRQDLPHANGWQNTDTPTVPKPASDEVLVNIKYSGVCHTDLHAVNGDWPLPTKLPLVGGHEGAGVVVARGELVKDVEIGDHAGVKVRASSSPQNILSLTTTPPSGSTAPASPATSANKAMSPSAPKPSSPATPLTAPSSNTALPKRPMSPRSPKNSPSTPSPPSSAPVSPSTKVSKSQAPRPGQTVAIVGAGGGLGSLACQYAKAMGLQIIAIDTGDDKKAMTAKLGADHFVDFAKSQNVVKDVQAATKDGSGPHAVILVAVNEKPFQQAAEYVRPRGTVVAIGLPAGAFLKAPVFETVIGMKTIKGSYVGNRKDTGEAIDFFARGLIKAPFKTIGLSELQKVYDLMHAGKIAGRYVVDTSK